MEVEDIPEVLDARCDGIGPADLVFVFGTREEQPARLAAEVFHRGLAPLVVVTGGAARQADGLNEAQRHRSMLVDLGVPDASIVAEDRSTHTGENVDFALELVQRRGVAPTSAIAVVKAHHRRALITLARSAPAIHKIYAVTYVARLKPRRVEKELEYLNRLAADGVDLLRRTPEGWQRSAHPGERQLLGGSGGETP